jgi:Carboxypeptidase regulatory-like domain
MTKKALLVFLFCCIVLSISPFMYGQANGSFSGTVADKTGSVISGATVKVTSQATGVSREARSDNSGHYLVPLLPVADYTIRVESQGFQAAEQKDLRLQIDEHREVNFTLAPGAVTEKVEVSATEVTVESANPTLGQVITAQQVADLPLNGRDFVQLATLTPGTTQETNPQSFFNNGLSSEVSARGTYSLSVGGSRAQSTDWLFDGNDNNELTAGGIAILPSIDAIQEFKVLTYNYSAEYGTRAGPTVLVTTKSGSNALHGSVFEFFRNTKLDARSFFAPTREQRNLNQFGGALGGPVQKDKTFFFIDYQGRRQRYGVPFVGLIPTPAMKIGDYSLDPFGTPRPGTFDGSSNVNGFPDLVNPYDFTPFHCNPITGAPLDAGAGGVQPSGINCNKIAANMIDPTGQAMMNFYPTANVSNAAGGFNFTNIPTRRLNEGEFDVRLDHNFSSKDSAFARFSYDQATSFAPGGAPGLAEQGAFASSVTFANHGRNVALSETHVFSDRTINQISGGFNRIFNHITSIAAGSCLSAKIGIQGANLGSACDSITGYPASLNQSTKDCESCGLSSTIVGNYWSLGDRGFAPFQGGTNVFSVSDSFDMIRGKHDIRIGGQLRANQLNVRAEAFQDGFLIPFGISGDASADLLMGQIGIGIHDQTFNGATTGRRWKVLRPFVQDDWRVTNNLTLNLGLAWAIVTPTTEAQNRQANFDVASGKLFVAGSASIAGCTICVHSDPRIGIQLDKTAVEPRIGLAWKPLGSEKSVIRAGYAIFHDSSWNLGGQGLWQNPPYLAESQNFTGIPTCPFGNTTINCGIQRVFLQANLQPILALPNPDTFPGAVLSQNRNFKQGMIQQYNLNIERQLPGNVVLTAGYAGSYSTHILVNGMNLAINSPSACPGGSSPVPGYTFGCGYVPPKAPFGVPGEPRPSISNVNDIGRARYNSLQIKAETKSARHGLYALFGYTYSRTFDSGFPDGLGTPPGATYWPLPGTQRADWALSQLNLNHSFTASVLYDLPFGRGKQFGSNWSRPVNAILGNWEVDVIEKATSGFPLYVVDLANASGSNFLFNGAFSLNRPNEISDPHKVGPVLTNSNVACHTTVSQGGSAPERVGTIAAWFNPCAFDHAPAGELGDSNRAPLYGPRFVNTDFSAIKHFPIRESMQLDFRAEFFNIFNHPQFGLTGDSSTTMQDIAAPSTFAKINETVHDPRVIQFALKLRF